MTYVDYEKQAEDYRREVSACYYRSRKYAKSAAREYNIVKAFLTSAKLATRYPVTQVRGGTPADYERLARSTEHLADSYLSASFRYHHDAAFYAGLARRYDELAKSSRKRLGA